MKLETGKLNQAAGKRRKRRLGRRLNHSRPEGLEVPRPAGRGMPDPGGSADNQASGNRRERLRRSRSPQGRTACREASAVNAWSGTTGR